MSPGLGALKLWRDGCSMTFHHFYFPRGGWVFAMVCLAKILGSPLRCIGQVTMAGYPANILNKSCAMIHHAMITSIVVHISSATGTLGMDWLAWNTNYRL